MSDNIWVNIIGVILVIIPVIEIFTGVATEKTGLVRRDERPGMYWFSIFCKLVVGIAILNIKYLRAKYGP